MNSQPLGFPLECGGFNVKWLSSAWVGGEKWDSQALGCSASSSQQLHSSATELSVSHGQGGREDTRCWRVLDDISKKLHMEKPGSQTCCVFNSYPFFFPPNLTLLHVNTLLKLHLFPEVSLINNSSGKCISLTASVLFPGHPSNVPVGFPNKTLLVFPREQHKILLEGTVCRRGG